MADLSVRQVQGAGALSAEHYQTFEMAKANDDILGGDNIAQIRSYAAYARAQAQAIHKTIAATSGIDDVAAIKAEAIETEQTFAKVGIYADQRIGEILRELPKGKGNQYTSASFGMAKEATKGEAKREAGISDAVGYDLELLAANPDVVEAVIARAEAEGRIPSRKQVTDEIKRIKAEKERAEDALRQAERERNLAERERDAARESLADAYRTNEGLEDENERLRNQPKPAPEIVEKEVPPKDYDELKRRVPGLENENRRLLSENSELRDANLEYNREIERLGNRKSSDANRDVEQLVSNIYAFLGRHGGKSRAFDQFYRVDETTRQECRKALVALGGFAQSLLAMTEETQRLGG